MSTLTPLYGPPHVLPHAEECRRQMLSELAMLVPENDAVAQRMIQAVRRLEWMVDALWVLKRSAFHGVALLDAIVPLPPRRLPPLRYEDLPD